jgi:hypothetical protein
MLVLNLAWCSPGFPQPTPDELQKVLWTGPNNMAEFFTKGSFGGAVMTKSDAQIVNVELPCEGDRLWVKQCNLNEAHDYIKANAAQYGITNFDAFNMGVRQLLDMQYNLANPVSFCVTEAVQCTCNFSWRS